jgi:autotransporter translocation and assembly factor TamB
LEQVRFRGEDTSLALSGEADRTTRTFNVSATGQASLGVLQAFYPSLTASGGATLKARLAGTFDEPELTGRADMTDGRLRHPAMPNSLSAINGPITVESGRISVDGLQAVMGEGPVTFTGGIVLDGYRPDEFNLHAEGESLHLRYPKGLQSTVHANLNLIGPVKSPVLSGTVDVLRASYSMRFQPERGYFGLFGGGEDTGGGGGAYVQEETQAFPLALAIKIRAPITPFVENKAAGAFISGSADVDVTGTISRPVVTGRVIIDRGEWIFSGNRYRVLSASIDFSNPLQFDPFFELTAETRARTPGQTYQVTVRITGTLDKLNLSLAAEPWLPEFQIMSLLLGETPDVGSAELRAQSSPQELQAQALRTAGFAILTSPVTATVGSAVQKATTVTAQIVPILGNESNLQQLNPTARIILGKRISERVYLTYSRTLSGAQNEIILVEFDQSDQLSWVLSRNEDRSFALDFRLRYIVR